MYVALSLAGLNCAISHAAPQVLTIATSELPPYISKDPQNSFLTELLQEIAKEMGVSIELRFMPWPRCELAVDSLQVWATMPYVPTQEREEKFLFSQPLYAKRTVLFYYSKVESDIPKTFTDLGELSQYRLGGVRGYYYESIFSEAGLPLALASSEELNFRKLHAGRVDLVPAVETVGWDIIRRTFSEEDQAYFGILDSTLDVGYNFLMTSRRYPQTDQLLERFNQALNTLQLNGVYREIAMRYGVVTNE